ncbi:MAG: PKD domain-containing protein [Candidatus Stygibacter frigidus]|nr:PKD domain-containing protein [Candidatus Stygibacter frigidus]
MKKREIFYFIILTLFLVGSHSAFADYRSATVDGYCYLEGAISHAGTKVLFTAVTPSAITDSTYTNADGSFLMGLSEGIYTVQYSHEGWMPNTISGETDFFIDTTLESLTLEAGGIEVSGEQSGVWGAGLTYNVIGDVSVTGTLIIEPGVTIRFIEYYSFTIYGTLVAAGTEADNIRFTSGQSVGNPNDWNNIKFDGNSASNSIISYSIIEYANQGIYCYSFSSPTISNNTISNNGTGIYCYSSSSPTISNNTITFNRSEEDESSGIYCEHSSPTISNNTISNNTYSGINCRYSSPTISNNTISYNNFRGIKCYYSSPTISKNTISNNSTGIYFYSSSSPTILNNILYDNYSDIFANSTPAALEHNSFWLNYYACEGSNIPAAFGEIVTVNANGDSCDTYYNLFMDPLFVTVPQIGNYSWTVEDSLITFYIATQGSYLTPYYFYVRNGNGDGYWGHMNWTGEYWTAQIDLYYFGENPINYFSLSDYGGMSSFAAQYVDFITEPNGPPFDPGNLNELDWHILEGSPCIDAGDTDPVYYDPDGTVADMGAVYFDQGSEAPVVNDITGEPVQGSAPLVVQFTHDITGPVTEYEWFFGEGGTSSLPNPVYVFTIPGIYSVTLTVTGPGGTDTMTLTDYITVIELQIPPDANFSATPLQGVMPLEVNFTNMSSGEVDSLFWEFGDGGFSTEINPAHEYQNSGIYTVSLTVYGPYGSDTEIKVDYVEVIEPEEVIAAFDVSGNHGCSPYTVTFINQSVGTIDSLLWDFGDGEFSVEENPVHIYEVAGVFEAILTVYGQLNTAIDTEMITVELAEPVILAITDIPEDQGGLVNVNFSRSFWDTDTLRTTEGYNIEIETDNGWTGVSSIYGYGAESYNVIVHTPNDSTAANNGLINFRVIAAMEEGNWVSESMQGYSVDNIAPAIPAELRLEAGFLVWSAPIDDDFAYFSVFRDEVLLNNCLEPEISLVGIMGELSVAAYDSHGNASQMSENITGGYPYGDPDNNLAVEAMDASLVLQYFCLLVPEGTTLPWENWRIEVADVDGSGVVEAYDAALILQFSVGFIDEFPVENLMRRVRE